MPNGWLYADHMRDDIIDDGWEYDAPDTKTSREAHLDGLIDTSMNSAAHRAITPWTESRCRIIGATIEKEEEWRARRAPPPSLRLFYLPKVCYTNLTNHR